MIPTPEAGRELIEVSEAGEGARDGYRPRRGSVVLMFSSFWIAIVYGVLVILGKRRFLMVSYWFNKSVTSLKPWKEKVFFWE